MLRPLALILAHIAVLVRSFPPRLALLPARGQGLVEYGLILVLIMVVCVGVLGLLGTTVSEVWYDRLLNNGAW